MTRDSEMFDPQLRATSLAVVLWSISAICLVTLALPHAKDVNAVEILVISGVLSVIAAVLWRVGARFDTRVISGLVVLTTLLIALPELRRGDHGRLRAVLRADHRLRLLLPRPALRAGPRAGGGGRLRDPAGAEPGAEPRKPHAAGGRHADGDRAPGSPAAQGAAGRERAQPACARDDRRRLRGARARRDGGRVEPGRRADIRTAVVGDPGAQLRRGRLLGRNAPGVPRAPAGAARRRGGHGLRPSRPSTRGPTEPPSRPPSPSRGSRAGPGSPSWRASPATSPTSAAARPSRRSWPASRPRAARPSTWPRWSAACSCWWMRRWRTPPPRA